MPWNSTTPAGQPPQGVTSDFVSPQYDGGRLVAVDVTFLSMAIIMMILRLYTQAVLSKRVGLDDYFMLLATVLSIAMSGLTLNLIDYGLGKHIWDVPQWQFAAGFFKIGLIAQSIYHIATAASKVSILLFYLRIFPSRDFRLVVWGVISVAIGYGLIGVFATLFSCRPIAKSWDSSILRGSCINRPALYYASFAIGALMDFATLLVPIPMLKKLQFSLKEKIIVGLMLILGLFVCITGIVRIGSVYKLLQNKDYTYASMNSFLWCTIELNTSIISGSIPTLHPLAQRHFPHLLRPTSQNPQSTSRKRNPHARRTLRIQSVESPYIGATTQKSFTNVVAGRGTSFPHVTTEYFRNEKFGAHDSYLPPSVPRMGIVRTMGYKVEEDYEQDGTC